MYGTCETLCRLLREQYPAETPLNPERSPHNFPKA